MTTDQDPSGINGPRKAVAVALAVVAAVFVALAVDAFFFQSAISDEDSFVGRVAPLPKDRAVSTALAIGVVEALEKQGTIEEQLSNALPDELDFLTPVLGGAAAQLVFDATRALVETDAFAAIWRLIAASTHRAILAAINDPTISGDLVFDLDAAAEPILERLELAGISIDIEPGTSFGAIVLISEDALDIPRRIARALQTALWVFPVAAAVLLGAAVAIDTDRLRPIQVAGFAVGGAILLNAALLAVVRTTYINSGNTLVDQASRRAVWDALTAGYLQLAALVAVVGVLIGTGAWWYRRSVVRRQRALAV